LKVGSEYIGVSFYGSIYKLDFSHIGSGVEIINYTRYDYVSFNDNFIDGLFVANGNLYSVVGNELYKSDDSGASFELINDNLPFQYYSNITNSQKTRKMVSINGDIIFIVGDQLYSSSDGGLSFGDIFRLASNYEYSLYTRGDYLIVAGDGGSNGSTIHATPWNNLYFTTFRNDLPFRGLVEVQSENQFRAYLGTSVYGANDIANPNELSLVKVLDNSDILIDVEEASSTKPSKPVFGIGNRVIYFDLF